MKILMIEDDPLTVTPYRIALQSREHQVVATDNRADRLKVYKDELDNRGWSKYNNLIPLPFDAVVLIIECQKGMERSRKGNSSTKSKTRIIFASAYVQDTLKDAVKELK